MCSVCPSISFQPAWRMQPIHQSSTWTLDNTSSPSNSSQTKGRRQSQASLRSQFWCRSEFVPINLSENFEGMTSHHTTVSKKSNTSKQYFQMRNNSTQSKGLSEKRPRACTFDRRFLNDLWVSKSGMWWEFKHMYFQSYSACKCASTCSVCPSISFQPAWRMQPIHQSSTWTLDNTSSPINSSQAKGRR